MQQITAKIIAFVCLLVIAIPVLLSLNFIIEETLLHQEAEERMNGSKLQSIQIANAGVHWLRKGKELIVDGRLFDVKEIINSGNGTLTITGFFDVKETALVSGLEDYTNQNNDAAGDLAFKFQLPVFQCTHAPLCLEASWHCISSLYYSYVSPLPVAPDSPFVHPPSGKIAFKG